MDQLPPFTDYAMAGRTYRFSEEKPLYPFGYGLSYTTFAYSNLQAPPELAIGQDLVVQVDVENTGQRTGDEVVQLYIKHLSASVPTPRHSLQGFARIPLEPGEKRTVTFRLSPRQLAVFDEDGRCLVEPGVVEIFVGGSQPDPRSQELTGEKPLSIRVKLEGSTVELPR